MSVSKDKIKFAAYLHPETLDKIKELYRGDDCSSKSEFIEKAVRFYIGYLTAEDKSNYLPNMFLSNMRAIASESDQPHEPDAVQADGGAGHGYESHGSELRD